MILCCHEFITIINKAVITMKIKEQELIKLYNEIFYFILSRIDDPDQAKDIAQSVMEIVIVNIDSLHKKDALKSWTMQIANNKINEYYRWLHKFRATHTDVPEELDAISDIEDIKADILKRLVDEEDMINIMKALNRLEQKYRDVIHLNIICEYNLIETAEILNQNVNTVRTWSARGLVKLKEEFERIEAGKI